MEIDDLIEIIEENTSLRFNGDPIQLSTTEYIYDFEGLESLFIVFNPLTKFFILFASRVQIIKGNLKTFRESDFIRTLKMALMEKILKK